MTDTNNLFPKVENDSVDRNLNPKTREERDAESRARDLARLASGEFPLISLGDEGGTKKNVYADLGGGLRTLNELGIIPEAVSKVTPTTTNNRPGYKTMAQRNARAHERQARRDRTGR